MIRTCFLPLAVGALSVAALSLATAHDFAPRLVWNASASAPMGLYRIDGRSFTRIGDLVLVKPDPTLRKFIRERGYLPPDIPLIKRIAALPGAKICRQNQAILIEELHVAEALLVDSRNRKMPVWSGCFEVNSDEVFLLSRHDQSLDGRYFGATKISNVTGVAIPMLIMGPH